MDETCKACGHNVDSDGCTFLDCETNTGVAALRAEAAALRTENERLKVDIARVTAERDLAVDHAHELDAAWCGATADRDHYKAKLDALIEAAAPFEHWSANDDPSDDELRALMQAITEARKPRSDSEGGG